LLYTPLLPGAAAGTLEPRHVVVPLREQLKRTVLHPGEVVGADPGRKVVRVHSLGGRETELPYDQLLVALGSRRARCRSRAGRARARVQDAAEAIALRNRLLQTLEQAEIEEDRGARASC
jgi:NADH dehydrogenase